MNVLLLRFVVMISLPMLFRPDGDAKDSRYASISKDQFLTAVSSTKRESEHHLVLISRSVQSGLGKLALDEYSRIAKKAPTDAYSQLHRGLAALAYWDYLSDTDMKTANTYWRIAGDSIARAAELAPDTPTIQREYGFYLWQFGGRMEEGIEILKKASKRLPHDPRTLELLGNVHSNRYGHAFNEQLATRELNEATLMDSSFARPHWLLCLLHTNARRQKEALAELKTYLSLMPAGTSEGPRVKPILASLEGRK